MISHPSSISPQNSDQAELIEKGVERLALPPRFKMASLHSFEADVQPTAVAFAQKFIDGYTKDTRRGLYLFGTPGSGKTHIACAIGNALVTTARPRFVTSPELLLNIKKAFNSSHPDDEYIDRLSHARLLIIDDLGSEKPTEWVQETLFVIIDRRYTHYLPTIFTSNYSLDELAERLGYKIASRIAEMAEVVELRQGDYRIRKPK